MPHIQIRIEWTTRPFERQPTAYTYAATFKNTNSNYGSHFFLIGSNFLYDVLCCCRTLIDPNFFWAPIVGRFFFFLISIIPSIQLNSGAIILIPDIISYLFL